MTGCILEMEWADLPNQASRLAILQVHNQDRPLYNVDLGYWAEMTEGWNGADLSLHTYCGFYSMRLFVSIQGCR